MKRSRVVAFLSIVSLASSLVAGCGAGPRAGGSGHAGATAPVRLDPAAARRSPQALILGTDERGGSTALPLPAGPHTVTVAALWVQTEDERVSGGTSALALTTRPSTRGEVRVGVYENVAGGVGPAWRAGVWVAASVAASVLDRDLTDFEFEASTAGHIDGASASALMTAGFVASMLGWTVDPTATLTGVINPDGTIGPVGGIPEKFAAAIAAGKRRLGYPIGLRHTYAADTGEAVDLVELARAAGAEAIEVADVHAAVALLTGKALPRSSPVAPAAMAIEPDIVDRLTERGMAWDRRVDELTVALDRATGTPGARALPVLGLVIQARDAHAVAVRHLEQGLASSGHHHIVRAWVAARAALAAASVIDAVAADQLETARAELRRLVAQADASLDVVRAIGARKPTTMGDHLLMLSAFDAAIDGWSFAGFADDLAGGIERQLARIAVLPAAQRAVYADALADDVRALAVAAARAEAAVILAGDTVELEAVASTAYRCSLPAVRRLGSSFRAAAGSNLTYAEALAGLSTSYGRAQMAAAEPDYMVAMAGSRVDDASGAPRVLKAEWGEGSLAWGLFQLAAGQQSFFLGTGLVSRWYSLGVRPGFDGRAATVSQERAFLAMLDYAEQRTREHARAALVATGEIPLQARLHYQTARVLRDGSTADKLDALAELWRASTYAQAAVMLARN